MVGGRAHVGAELFHHWTHALCHGILVGGCLCERRHLRKRCRGHGKAGELEEITPRQGCIGTRVRLVLLVLMFHIFASASVHCSVVLVETFELPLENRGAGLAVSSTVASFTVSGQVGKPPRPCEDISKDFTSRSLTVKSLSPRVQLIIFKSWKRILHARGGLSITAFASRSFESKAREWDFTAARRHPLNPRNAAFGSDESMVKIVHRGTNVSWNQIKDFSQRWDGSPCEHFDRQMFFARSKRLCFWMTGDDAIRHSAIHR